MGVWSTIMKNLIQVKIKQEEIERVMARLNLTRSSLAEQIPVAKSWLTRVIVGEQPISPRLREKIMKSLNCNFDDIFFIESVNQVNDN